MKSKRRLQIDVEAPKTKVCPSCGCCPWDIYDEKKQPDFCQDCGDKLIPRSELPRDIWKDPAVRETLKQRQAWDIALLRCPECNELGYYNEGTTFSCRFCDLTYYVVSESEEGTQEGVRTVSIDEMIRLDDTVTETTDGYDNRTI